MLDYFASDCDLAEELSGEALSGYLPALLVRCYDGSDLRQLRLMIETEAFEPIFRHECLQAYHGLALAGRIDKAEVVAFAGRLLDAVPADATYDRWYVWLALAAAELQEPALRERIEALFDRGLTSERRRAPSSSSPTRRTSPTSTPTRPNASPPGSSSPASSTTSSNGSAAGIGSRSRATSAPADTAERAYEACRYDLPYVRTQPKVGRNDPCLCGSGKKYKKCCLH